jgi:hypothetical protein
MANIIHVVDLLAKHSKGELDSPDYLYNELMRVGEQFSGNKLCNELRSALCITIVWDSVENEGRLRNLSILAAMSDNSIPVEEIITFYKNIVDLAAALSNQASTPIVEECCRCLRHEIGSATIYGHFMQATEYFSKASAYPGLITLCRDILGRTLAASLVGSGEDEYNDILLIKRVLTELHQENLIVPLLEYYSNLTWNVAMDTLSDTVK